MPHVQDFDASKLIVGEPEENEQGKFKSALGYEGELDDPQCTPKSGKWKNDDEYVHIDLPPMFCFGVSKSYTPNKPRTAEFHSGYQVCVQMTSPDTVNDMTKEEQATSDFNDGLCEAVANYMIENKSELPVMFQHMPDQAIRKMVRPLFNHPNKKPDEDAPPPAKGKKRPPPEVDTSKPKRAYLPLIFWKKSGSFSTRIFGPGDKKVDPLKYEGVYGMIEPSIRLNWAFYGDKAVSLNVEMTEANFVPTKRKEPTRRLGSNDAPEEADIDEDEFARRAPRGDAPAKNLSPPTTYNPEEDGEVQGPREDAPQPKYQIKTLKDGRKVKVFQDGKKVLVK